MKYTLFDFDNLEYRAFIVTYRIRYCWFYRLERRNFYINSNFPCEKQIVGILYPLRACCFFCLICSQQRSCASNVTGTFTHCLHAIRVSNGATLIVFDIVPTTCRPV